jgi:hypothetical protein
MAKRVIVVIDIDLLKKLQYMESHELIKTQSFVGLSRMINKTFRKSLNQLEKYLNLCLI